MADNDDQGPSNGKGQVRSSSEGPKRQGRKALRAEAERQSRDRSEGSRAGSRPGRGRSEPGAAREGSDEAEEPKVRLGEPRNEHGTRTARRIRCTRCGKVDHVPGGPREKTKVMCRTCLEEVKDLYEVGVREKGKTKPADCTVCGKHFDLPLSIDVDDEEIVCFDCMRGFTTWQGAVSKPATRDVDLGEARRPGVRLRKKTTAED